MPAPAQIFKDDCASAPAQITKIDQCENKIAASYLFHQTEHHRIKSCIRALRRSIRMRMEARSLFQTPGKKPRPRTGQPQAHQNCQK